MTNKEQYKAVFAHLHASGDTLREGRHMKKNHMRKGLVIGVAAAALMATAAGAANVATEGRFFEEVCVFLLGEATYNEDGSRSYTATDGDGNKINVQVQEAGDGVQQDGVNYSVATGGEEGDVTVESGEVNDGIAGEHFAIAGAADGDRIVVASKKQAVE